MLWCRPLYAGGRKDRDALIRFCRPAYMRGLNCPPGAELRQKKNCSEEIKRSGFGSGFGLLTRVTIKATLRKAFFSPKGIFALSREEYKGYAP